MRGAMTTQGVHRRWSYIYALLIGVLGMITLTYLFARQAQPVDRATLLLFTVVAVVVSYFKVPINGEEVSLSLGGAVLLGATLVGGAALGGWAAFITGLVTSIEAIDRVSVWRLYPFSTQRPAHIRWIDRTATALLNSGRNVIAVAVAWWAYQGMGGRPSPVAMDPALPVALIVMCVVYTLVRTLVSCPAQILRSATPLRELANVANATALLAELVPLPVSLLISSTFVALGWSFFLILALTFIGTGAVMRHMLDSIRAVREQITALSFGNQIREAITGTPREVHALCTLAYELVRENVPSAKFEMGLYDPALAHVNMQIAVHDGQELPPMRVPLTPLWQWLSELEEPVLVRRPEDFDSQILPLPPIRPGIGDAKPLEPQSAMFLSLPRISDEQEEIEAVAPPLGAMVLQSPRPNAFGPQDMAQVAIIGQQVGIAIQRTQALSPEAAVVPSLDAARQIQAKLLPPHEPTVPGWDVAAAWEWSAQFDGSWYDWLDARSIALSEGPARPSSDLDFLSAAVAASNCHALVQGAAHASSNRPARTLGQANECFWAADARGRQASVLFVTVGDEGALTWANAGCHPPLWWHSGDQHLEELISNGAVLGAVQDAAYQERSVPLAPGDMVLIYTDSLTHACNPVGEMFGSARLSQAVQAHANGSAHEAAQGIVGEVRAFARDAPLEQDLLLVVLRHTPERREGSLG